MIFAIFTKVCRVFLPFFAVISTVPTNNEQETCAIAKMTALLVVSDQSEVAAKWHEY